MALNNHAVLTNCHSNIIIHAPYSLRWRHNELDGVSDHQPHDCLLNRLFGRRSKKTSKLCVTGLCAGNSPGTDEFPARMSSNAETVSIWWRHHVAQDGSQWLTLPGFLSQTLVWYDWLTHDGKLYMCCFNTLRPRQMDGIWQTTFSNAFSWISLKSSLKFVPKGLINN